MTVVDTALLSPRAIDDPYSFFATYRESAPVVFNEQYRLWLITRHDDIMDALRDPRLSSDRLTPVVASRYSGPDVDPALRAAFATLNEWLVFKDPPEHGRLRRLVHRAFTPRAVELMTDRVREVLDEQLERLEPGSSFDFLADVAFPLPAIIIAEMLGVPIDDRDRFRHWSDQLTSLVFGGFDAADRHTEAAHGMEELVSYLDVLVSQREASPEDDLITALVRAQDEGDALTRSEVIATCILLLFAGHETTANLLGNGLRALLDHPEQAAALRDGEVDPRGAVEEIVRYDGPAKSVVRAVVEPLELRGQRLEVGDRVFLVIAAANRDPRVFDDPDTFDLSRDPKGHLGFGFGIHYCLGAPLARLEAAVALPRTLRRLRGLRMTTTEHDWKSVLLTRGMEKLPLTFDELVDA